MTLPKKGRRKITVGDNDYYWVISSRELSAQVDIGSSYDIELALQIEPKESPKQKLRLLFRGTCVPYLFSLPQQNLTIKPSTVRQAIEDARRLGWPRAKGKQIVIEHAERRYAKAVLPLDIADHELRAACEKWFVPYPGREEIVAVLSRCGGDLDKVGACLPELPIERLVFWLTRLKIDPNDFR